MRRNNRQCLVISVSLLQGSVAVEIEPTHLEVCVPALCRMQRVVE